MINRSIMERAGVAGKIAEAADQAARERSFNIQALRAVAAWGVVGHHLVDAPCAIISLSGGCPMIRRSAAFGSKSSLLSAAM
jgi:hypothetical protein